MSPGHAVFVENGRPLPCGCCSCGVLDSLPHLDNPMGAQPAAALQATAQRQVPCSPAPQRRSRNVAGSADRSLLQNFANRLNLTLAQKGGDAGNDWQTLDYIYYRSGDDAVLLKADSGEVDALTVDLKPLSDHPALYAKIFVE